jgi:phosphoribosylanthranilate isomerase
VSGLWIKICGMTTPEAVAAALASRVDAIGFVFAESTRQVTPQKALQLAAVARGRVRCVAVTRHPTQKLIDEIVKTFRPDALQTDLADLPSLHLPRTLEILPVLRTEDEEPAPLPARLLFEGEISGSGIRCDWSEACLLSRRTQLVLAGGLSPENVAAAISAVRPFGVDVSSGVEQQPGIKSPDRIAQFVQAARATQQEFPS